MLLALLAIDNFSISPHFTTFHHGLISSTAPLGSMAQDQFLQKLLESGRPEDLRTAAKLSSQGYRSYVWREGGKKWTSYHLPNSSMGISH